MKNFTLLLIAVFCFASMQAQTARVQIIHNSADAAANEVDIYLDGALAIDNFAFRTATAFLDLPATVEISIAVAPGNSTGVGDAIATFPVTLAEDETYIVVADGIVSGSGYNPATPFNLEIFAVGRESASDGSNTDILVHHGATDAPTVDVVEVGAGAGTIVNDLSYAGFQGYLELPTSDYALEVRDETGTVTVASYEAPLATLGLNGAAAVAVASGFLDPTQNSDGPAFGIWVALPSGGPMVELPASTARVQVIHNSADAAAAEVDVYLGSDLAIDNFAFRTATPYLDLPAGTEIAISVAPGNSTGVGDAIATFPLTLERNETYAVVANGIVSGSGYDPIQPFTLDIFAGAREVSNDPSFADILIHHGSTDAPTVDLVETGVGIGPFTNDLSYTEYRNTYLELPSLNYSIEVRDETGTVSVAGFELPVADLGVAGLGLTAVASGFLNPAANSNGPGFEIYVALPSGGPMVALPTSNARLQVIHNSADLAAAEVDVYINDVLTLDNFAFRTATPFIDIPAGTTLDLAIAPSTSTSSGDAIANFPVTFSANKTYVVVADGIVSPSGYDPAPAFNLEVYDMGRELAIDPTQVDVLIHHGSTDAPTVDIVEVGVGAGTLVDDISYTEFQGYLELPTANYSIEVRDETGTVTVAAYEVPLIDLGAEGAAVVAVASGFLDPSVNSDGPAFGIWVALADGGPLLELAASTSRVQVIHNSADAAAEQVDVYIGDDLAVDNFTFRTATPYIDFPAGVETVISVAPPTSTGVGDAIASFPVTLAANQTYIVVADGIVSPTGYDPAPPFGLEVYPQGRETATNSSNTDVLVHHGSTDAPTVDVVETGVGAGTIVDDISYSEFQGYLELPTVDYVVDVRDESGTTTVATYSAPLSTLGLDGEAITVVASGFLDPSVNSDGAPFGLWVALAAGGDLVELPNPVLSVSDFDTNAFAIYPNPSRDLLNISGLADGNYTISLIDLQGRTLTVAESTPNTTTIDVSGLATGMYQLVISSGNEILGSKKFVKN